MSVSLGGQTAEVQMTADKASTEVGSSTQSAKQDQLRPLADYIKQLYLVGGVPLVVLGVGAANLFLPYSSDNPGAKLAVTILLFAIGGLAWGASTYVALHRWKVELEALARQDEILLQTICEIVQKEERSESAEKRIAGLMGRVNNLGVRWARSTGGPRQLANGAPPAARDAS